MEADASRDNKLYHPETKGLLFRPGTPKDGLVHVTLEIRGHIA